MSIRTLVGDIKAVLAKDYGEIPDGLREPISDDLRSSLIEQFSGYLPNELMELLEIQDGENQGPAASFIEGAWLFPAETILDDYKFHVQNSAKQGLLDVDDPENFKAIGNVRPSLWRSGWIPFMEIGKTPWVVDMSPPEGGILGQIISINFEDGEIKFESKSIYDILDTYNKSLGNGTRDFLEAFNH